MKFNLPLIVLILGLLAGCSQQSIELPHRESLIPDSAVKMSPENDLHPPVSYTDEFEQPVPLPYPVNTRGYEDSAFILPDGQTLYFVFVPDANLDFVDQSQDLVTGIYVTHRAQEGWTEPERVWLIEPGTAVLDGCQFVTTDSLWFCTVREGLTGIHWFRAENVEGQWKNWQINDFDTAFDVGEFHIYGNQLYYHSSREGGLGGLDIWMLTMGEDGRWENPVNVTTLNTVGDEGWPALSPDGTELWISRDYGLWRSVLVDGIWTEPMLMFSPLAGEATIDGAGNVYFTHHFYDETGETMLDADIYIAYRK